MSTFDERVKRLTKERARTALLLLAVMAFAAGFLTIGFAAGKLTTAVDRDLLERCVAAGEYSLPIVLWADSVRHVQMDALPPINVAEADGG